MVKIKERSGVKRLSSRYQSQAKCVIWTFCSFGKIRKMANSVNDEVVSFNSALGKALKNPSGFNVPRALRSEQKGSNFYTAFGGDLLGVLPTGF